ncbi:plasmid mobilization protein, partial [Ligilactobacillus salivarius]
MFKRENRDEVIRLRVTKEEKDVLKKFAKEKGLTMSAVVAQALDNYLDATAPKDFEKMEVHYDGKKDKALTRKAQNALAFSKRFDEIMGNKTSLYDMDKKYQEAYFEKLEEGVKKYKDDEKSAKEN